MAPSDAKPDTLESEIEATRARLAATIDQLAYRASPKTIVKREVNGFKAHFVDAQGSPRTIVKREIATFRGYFVDAQGNPRTDNILKVAGGALGFVVFVVVMRKVTR